MMGERKKQHNIPKCYLKASCNQRTDLMEFLYHGV